MKTRILSVLAAACALLQTQNAHAIPILHVDFHQDHTAIAVGLYTSGIEGATGFRLYIDNTYMGDFEQVRHGVAGVGLFTLGDHVASMEVNWGSYTETVAGDAPFTVVENYIGVPDAMNAAWAALPIGAMFLRRRKS